MVTHPRYSDRDCETFGNFVRFFIGVLKILGTVLNVSGVFKGLRPVFFVIETDFVEVSFHGSCCPFEYFLCNR